MHLRVIQCTSRFDFLENGFDQLIDGLKRANTHTIPVVIIVTEPNQSAEYRERWAYIFS